MALFEPQSTGITFALTDKAPADKMPLLTMGYGLSAAQDGFAFAWNFPIMGSYWTGADILVQHLLKKDGSLKGKKIALVYHDSPFGKEPIPLLQERAKLNGFELQLIPVAAPGAEQKAAWLQIRQSRPGLRLPLGLGDHELDRAEGSAGDGLSAREDVRRVVGRRRARRARLRRRRQGLQRARAAHRRASSPR